MTHSSCKKSQSPAQAHFSAGKANYGTICGPLFPQTGYGRASSRGPTTLNAQPNNPVVILHLRSNDVRASNLERFYHLVAVCHHARHPTPVLALDNRKSDSESDHVTPSDAEAIKDKIGRLSLSAVR